jgi:hypothetical protein
LPGTRWTNSSTSACCSTAGPAGTGSTPEAAEFVAQVKKLATGGVRIVFAEVEES